MLDVILLARFAKITGIAVSIVTVIVLGLAWFLARPKGELRLALSPSVQSDLKLAGLASSLFQIDSTVDEAQHAAEYRPLLQDPIYKQAILDAYYTLSPSMEIQSCED